MKYKVGDKVKVREDLKEGYYNGIFFNEYFMGGYKGQLATVTEIHTDEEFRKYVLLDIDHSSFVWHEDMLEKPQLDKELLSEYLRDEMTTITNEIIALEKRKLYLMEQLEILGDINE